MRRSAGMISRAATQSQLCVCDKLPISIFVNITSVHPDLRSGTRRQPFILIELVERSFVCSTGSIFLSTSESTSAVVTLFSGIAGYRGVWHDGASHFYIDGNVMKNGEAAVLSYDSETEKYSGQGLE